ncbi:DUF4373 domain-containing protein [Empedobacter falsenii]
MARPIKTGLDYFPLDIDFFEDIKIRKLIKYLGAKSISVYAYLLCKIYREGYFIKWDIELPFIISEATGLKEEYVNEVVKFCLRNDLFSENLYNSKNILSSKGIQERYKLICSTAKRKYNISKHNLVNSEETLVNSEETLINSEETLVNSEFSTQSKGKERKVNTTTEVVVEKSEKNPQPQNEEIHIKFCQETLESRNWIEAFLINLKIPNSKNDINLKRLLKDFLNHLILENKIHTKKNEFQSHFTSWCRKLDDSKLKEIYLKKSQPKKTQPKDDYYFLN